MQSTYKANLTHGQKVTTDPDSRFDPKFENSGPVPKDSLAADSLRHGGAFSRGNPTGISGARGSSRAFAVGPNESGNVHTIHGKIEGILDPRNLGSSTEKTKETSISGGKGQAQEAFNASHSDNKGASTIGRTSKGTGGRGGKGGGGGLSASKYSDASSSGQGSRHIAGGGSSGIIEPHVKHIIPNTARPEETLEEGLDWSKIPKDATPNTDIGGPNDPSRIAKKHMIQQMGRRGQGLGHTGGKVGGGNDNLFGVLNDSECS